MVAKYAISTWQACPGSVVNGVVVGAAGTASIQLVGNNTLPAISLIPPANFSGDIKGITVTLRAQDTDADSTGTIDPKSDSVTLNLYVTPVADDITAPNVPTTEDKPVKFMENLAVSDTGTGVESITEISVKVVPAGWVIKDHNGVTVNTGNGTAGFDIPVGDIAANYKNYTITPPAHSSADATLTLSITSKDTNTVNNIEQTSTITADHAVKVTVTPVAEKVGGDSNGDLVPDLTMTQASTTPARARKTSGSI